MFILANNDRNIDALFNYNQLVHKQRFHEINKLNK